MTDRSAGLLSPARPDMKRHHCPACDTHWACYAERRGVGCIFDTALLCPPCARGDQP